MKTKLTTDRAPRISRVFHVSPTRRNVLRTLAGLALAPFAGRVAAEEKKFELFKTFQTPEAFIQEVFGATPPPVAAIDGGGGKRVRYWRSGTRTAFILEDIGKAGYQPTTAGFVVTDQTIEAARVLIYRESRGEQIGERSFLQQFTGAKSNGGALSRNIDNISGATYSVNLMKRMAVQALALDAQIPKA